MASIIDQIDRLKEKGFINFKYTSAIVSSSMPGQTTLGNRNLTGIYFLESPSNPNTSLLVRTRP